MRPTNVLLLMSDEHNPKILGCGGHPVIRTPNLDALAARGTRFTSAYTNSPICVPARASFATGQYVHTIRYWDNALPYEGRIPAWGHRLMDTGHRSVSVGKLHYRSAPDPCGFDEEWEPMHVIDGVGDLTGLIRTDPPVRKRARKYIEEARSGDSTYIRYDSDITSGAVRWLREEAPKYKDTPWVLFVSWVCPHFPLVAPPEFFDLYPLDAVPWPVQNEPGVPPPHPAVAEYWRLNDYSTPFSEEQTRRAIAAYYGMVSYMDVNVGKVLQTLEDCGLGGNTRVLYTSDHGDNLGRNGLYGKSTMYEDSAGIPLIVAGPDLPRGKTSDTVASLVDVFPTVMEWAGEPTWPEDSRLPGHSLHPIANGAAPERTVLSEYHATCSTGGIFMIRKEQYKYIHYVNFRPALYDLRADPDETEDLAERSEYRGVVADCEAALRDLLDPERVDALAKHDQGQRIFEHGGRERILGFGTLGYTPAPGEPPDRG
jgi:choline-sulfatase